MIKRKKLFDEVLKEYEVVPHPEYNGLKSEKVSEVLNIPLEYVVKCLIVKVLKGTEEYIACIISGDRRLSIGKLSKTINVPKKKLRLALPKEIETLGYSIGCIPPTITIEKHVEGCVDMEVLKLPFIIASAGEKFYGIKFNPTILLNIGYKPAILT